MDNVELVLKRKIAKVVKTWAPVLVLMGLLIAVDSLDSVQGETLLSKMKFSLGFETQKYHPQQVPAYTFLLSNRKTDNSNIKVSEFWKARHLLQRPTPPAANPTPQFGPVPPRPPQLGTLVTGVHH